MSDNSTLETDTQDTFMEEAGTYMAFRAATYITNYWVPTLIPFGLVGNTFLVMMRTNNRKISTCTYMPAISINDSLLLSFALHDWLVGAVNIHKWYL